MTHDTDDEGRPWEIDYAHDQTRYDEDWLAAHWDALQQCDLSEDDDESGGDELIARSDDGVYLIYARPNGEQYAVHADVEADSSDEYDLSDLGLEFTPSSLVKQPPAQRLDQWLQVRVSRKSYERIYSQIVLDIRDEHSEALASGNEGQARLVIMLGYLSVAWALLTELRFVNAVVRALRGS